LLAALGIEGQYRNIYKIPGTDVPALYTSSPCAKNKNSTGELLRTGWPEIDERKVISFPTLSQKEEGLPAEQPEALVN